MPAYIIFSGPNAHVIVEKKNAEEVKNRLLELFEPKKIIYAGTGEGPYIAKDEGHLIDQKLNPYANLGILFALFVAGMAYLLIFSRSKKSAV